MSSIVQLSHSIPAFGRGVFLNLSVLYASNICSCLPSAGVQCVGYQKLYCLFHFLFCVMPGTNTACEDNFDCHLRGFCADGKCECHYGYSGPFCAEQVKTGKFILSSIQRDFQMECIHYISLCCIQAVVVVI